MRMMEKVHQNDAVDGITVLGTTYQRTRCDVEVHDVLAE